MIIYYSAYIYIYIYTHTYAVLSYILYITAYYMITQAGGMPCPSRARSATARPSSPARR